MIITCASCLTKFKLDDARISPKGVKVRCSRCKHVFYVVPPPETKEEVLETFESFAKFHEDLMEPRGEALKRDLAAEGEILPPPAEKEGIPQPPKPSEIHPSEKEEEAFLFGEKVLPVIQKEEREKEVLPEEAEKEEAKPYRPKELTRRRERRGPSLFLAILLVLILLIFGFFYLWTELESGGRFFPYLEKPIQKITWLWNKVWGTEKEGLEIGDLTGYEERVGEIPLFIIEGKVRNQSRYPKKYIKVKVVIYDQNKSKIAEKEAICGRLISRQELKSQPPIFYKGEMVVKPQTDQEMAVLSGKMAPFMVILRDLSSQAKEFKVEILEAPNQ